MSKELEDFEEMYNWIYCNTETTYEDDVKLDKIRKNVKQALQRLEAIDNANPSEALSRIEDCLYEDPYADRKDVSYENDIATIKQALLKAQKDEKLKVDICEMFGLDNLFPYNDTKAILKELEEYMGERDQLWVDFIKKSKRLKEQEKVLEILKKHKINIYRILDVESVSQYNEWENDNLVEEEFYLLKRWAE